MADCKLLSVEDQLVAEVEELRKEVRQLTQDIESGFMKGAYARMCELQEIERKYWELINAN